MSYPEATSGDFLAGFMDDYFAECDEHLTSVRRILAEAQPALAHGLPAAALEELFRSFHSIKGLSGMVQLRDAELLAHHMESYLRLLRSREAPFTAAGLDGLINGTSLLERVIAARRGNQPGPSISAALAQLDALAPSAAPPLPDDDAAPEEPAAPPSADGARWRVHFDPSPERAARGITVDRIRARLQGVSDIVDAAPRIGSGGAIRFEFTVTNISDPAALESWAGDGVTAERIVAAPARLEPAGAAAPPTEGAPAVLTSSHFVRVDLTKLDELMRMIGDIVISRARLAESLLHVEGRVPAVEWRAVQENSNAIERQLRDLREGVMRVRLVRVGEIFGRMPFVVRDLARESGRQVELQISGQDTEIDKYLVERMMDPVLHLVRNAVSHGIESVDERRAAGKPEQGRLTLSAVGVGDVVTLEIADDGRGIDVAAVRKRARAMGVPVADGPLEEAQILDLLCLPGFSTRDAADRAAGRGVGMEVVHRAVRELGGSMTLDSSPGEGTRFLIELPLTLAITDAIIASVGGQQFALPQSSIREVVEIERDAIRRLENNEIVPYRGGVLPIVRLSSLFGLAPRPERALHVFVVGTGLAAFGLAVDRIHTQREIVVRPITDPLIKVDGVTGATDLGDGKVVLILDAARVARKAGGGKSAA
ncbi:MAG TPA: chemotaxis protein CheA [Vicinamibacterales bacterium]|nr:chemotaxis protein CheA [Vicinamibacterales bacterium]